MTEASIPVDLFNPGKVLASLGFLEVADVLTGAAEGGFNWTDDAHVRFHLWAVGNENPFAVVLKFLAEAQVSRYAPAEYTDRPPKKQAPGDNEDEARYGHLAPADSLIVSESFASREADQMALPVRLHSGQLAMDLTHWADGSNRNKFKLYAGNRSAWQITHAMLRGVTELWKERRDDLTAKPFDLLTPMGGSFNFDPRGAWTALDAGYSPNQHNHGVAASPVVEILAAFGLEYARPDEHEKRQVRYGAWSGLVPPILARPALAGVTVGIPVRRFRFVLELSGKNKVVTFAQEEANA